MTETRELQDARASRAAARRRWRCRCGEDGAATSTRLAVAELLAHDEIAHVVPAKRLRAAEAMLRGAA